MLYVFQARQDHKGSFYVVIGKLLAFNLYVYAFLDLGATIFFIFLHGCTIQC